MTSCLKKSLVALHTFSKYSQYRRISQSITSMNLAVPKPDGEPKNFSPKIEEIAEKISQLSLIEVAELSDLLKKKLNIPDAPMMSFAAQSPAAPTEEEPKNESAQINFSVKLVKFDEKQKVALIKEIKSMTDDMNLVQAKKFVESAPVIVKKDISKTEAEKLKETLTKIGAEIEIF